MREAIYPMKIKNNAKRRSTKRMPVLSNSTPFAVKESYMDLCTHLMFSVNSKGEHSKVFVITSTVESEGKSTVAANTAVGLAMLGKKVLLVDSDMRLPAQNRIWGFHKSNGLSNLLSDFGECRIHAVKDLPLSIISAGNRPPNPSKLLSSVMFKKCIGYFRQAYDYVILDLPPVGVVPDAVIAGHEADGVIYVVKSGEVNSKELAEQLDVLQQAGIECCGFVLNAVDQKNKSHYGKYNSYYNR